MKHRSGLRHAAGFTLIEIAVVLVIIGLLMGSVMTARTLIESAEYRALRNQIDEFEAAWHTFRERYRALPGDFARADARLGTAGADGNGNGVIEGGPGCTNAADESCRAWQHLRAAGLVAGDPAVAGPASTPTHPWDAPVSGFFTGVEGNGRFGHKLLFERVPADVAHRLAVEIDDGRPDRGRVSCVQGCDGTGWPAQGHVDIAYML